MRQMLIRSAILITACGWAGSAYCAPLIFFGGFYSIQADAFDGSFPGIPNSGHVLEQQQLDFNKTGGSGVPRQLGTSAGNAIAAGQIAVSSAPGVLAAYADAAATATNGGFSAAVAGAKTSAGATMIDEWTFDFGHPVKRTHVEAAFSLSADLTTTADGVNSTSPNERVDARAFADVRVSGDGISPNLAIGHTLDTFGLSEDAVLSQTINPHTRFPPPMTIPVSLDFEGNFVDVLWRLIVEAEATVRSNDVVNRQSGLAIAIADASHTLTWGGIISVTNADTGELITDYTLTSASGFDYTHPFSGPIPEPGSVPEPSGIGLLASCLALMLLWRSGVARHHWHYLFIRRRPLN